MIKLGRIGYVNMAPVFFRLDAEVEEVVGVPTELNRQLVAGELDVAPISSIEYARNAATLRLLPRLCVSSEGAVESIQLISKTPLDQIRTVAVTPESATSVVLTQRALPRRGAGAARRGRRGEAADRRRRAEVRLRGPDAAPRSRPPVARAHRPADGVRGLGCARAVASRSARARGGARRVAARRARGARAARVRVAERYGYPGRVPRALLREAPLPLRPARARGPLHVPRARARRRRARRGAGAAVRHRGRAPSERSPTRDPDGEDDHPATMSASGSAATSAMQAAPPTTFSQRGQRRCSASCVQRMRSRRRSREARRTTRTRSPRAGRSSARARATAVPIASSAWCGTWWRGSTAASRRGRSPLRAIARLVRPSPATSASSEPRLATAAPAGRSARPTPRRRHPQPSRVEPTRQRAPRGRLRAARRPRRPRRGRRRSRARSGSRGDRPLGIAHLFTQRGDARVPGEREEEQRCRLEMPCTPPVPNGRSSTRAAEVSPLKRSRRRRSAATRSTAPRGRARARRCV